MSNFDAAEFAKDEFGPLGPPTGIVYRGKFKRGPNTVYKYNVTYGSDQEFINVGIDPQNKIDGFLFHRSDESADPTKVNTGLKEGVVAMQRLEGWLRQIASGDIDRSQLTESFSEAFTPLLAARAKNAFARLGTPKRVRLRTDRERGGSMMYTSDVTFTRVKAKILLGVDAAGKIQAFTYHLSH